jgi:two-component system sensor kinase FixL
MKPIRILYVDDYPLDRELVRDALEKEHDGFEVVEAASRADFEAALAQGGFDLILSDFNILGFEGLQVLDAVRTINSHLPVILVTGTGSEEVAAEAIKRGAADYVIKTPKHIQRLPHIVHSVLEKKRLEDERQQAEEALRESEERYRRLHESMRDCFAQVKMSGEIVDVNLAYLDMLGYSKEEVLKLHYADITPHRWHRFEQGIVETQILPFGYSEVYEKEYIKKDGTVFPIELRAFLLRNAEGQPSGMWAIVRDITERRQAEEKIRAMNAELEQRVEERTRELREAQEQLVQQERLAVLGRLAGGVSQELRNPLGVILNAIYYLRLIQPDASEKVQQYHGMIEQEAHSAEKIITNLLDFASLKIMDRELLSVPELVARTLEQFPIPASVKLCLNLPADLPRIYADQLQMTQALGSLIVNAHQAMTSTPLREQASSVGAAPTRGDLAITAHQEQGMLAIAVKDTGVGIPPENMKRLFEPLFTTKPKGIGLGLAVSQKLVEANGGKIEVESEVGKGSTFTLWLPVKQ